MPHYPYVFRKRDGSNNQFQNAAPLKLEPHYLKEAEPYIENGRNVNTTLE
jgi:hypothetical protein